MKKAFRNCSEGALFTSEESMSPCKRASCIKRVFVFSIMTMLGCLETGSETGFVEDSEPAAGSLNAVYRGYLPIVYGINGGSGVYATGIRIQNPGASTATVRMRLYLNDSPAAVLRGTVTSGGSVTLNPLHVLPAGWITESAAPGVSLLTFSGSATLEADQPVATAVNLIRNCSGQPCAMGSYSAVEHTARELVVPLVQKNTFGISSWLAIQNAGTEIATISITFVPRGVGTAVSVFTTMSPGAAAQLRTEQIPGMGATFSGSAIIGGIFGSAPTLAIIANVEKHDELVNMHSLQSSSGFDTALASSSIALPLVMANNFGLFTSPLIVNAGAVTTTVRVDYSPNQAVGAANACAPPPSKTIVNVAPGSAVSYVTGGNEPGFVGCRYVGSARVSSIGAPIVALVGEGMTGASAASLYEGIDIADTHNTVSLPIVMANNGGFFTGVQIQNVAGKAAQVVLRYEPNTATGSNACAQPPAVTQSLQAGASANILQASGFFVTCRYVGSATVTAQNSDGSSGRIAVLVNEARLAPDSHQDALLTYMGRRNP